MSIAVVAWQVFIFFTLLISGSKRGLVAAFWVIWTLLQVFALPLSIIQFFTIFLGYKFAGPSESAPTSPPPASLPRQKQSSAFSAQPKPTPFRSRALEIVRNELNYSAAIPGPQQASFDSIVGEMMITGGNEYDAAIKFMLIQIRALSKPLSEQAQAFTDEKVALIGNIIGASSRGSDLVNTFLHSDPA